MGKQAKGVRSRRKLLLLTPEHHYNPLYFQEFILLAVGTGLSLLMASLYTKMHFLRISWIGLVKLLLVAHLLALLRHSLVLHPTLLQFLSLISSPKKRPWDIKIFALGLEPQYWRPILQLKLITSIPSQLPCQLESISFLLQTVLVTVR